MKKNSNFESAMNKYKAEASRFDSFSGPVDSFIGENRMSNFVGQPSNADGAMSQGNAAFAKIPDTLKIYTVVINNTLTTGDAVQAVVFGGYQYQGATQANAGVTVAIRESSHAQVRVQSTVSPFWVNGLRYLCSTTSQLNNQIVTIQNVDPAGSTNTVYFRPQQYKTADQNSTTQVDAPTFSFGVDGGTQLLVPVEYSTQVTLTLQIGGRFDASNSVNGNSPLQVANMNPLRTGLVTIQR